MNDPAILPFWFGEPDEVTPPFIREAATVALARGETFYTENFGIPELREAVAAYLTRLHRPTAAEEIAITASGMSALMLTAEALVDPGDARRGRDAGVAEPHRDPENSRRRRRARAARLRPRRLDARLRAPAGGADAGTRARSSSTRRTTRRAGRSTRRTSARFSPTAAATASGSSPTTSTSGSRTRTPALGRLARRRSSTWPRPTTGWSAPTASRSRG